MGKLNIAHHKSYHPYRLDNIERVRKDEEEARRKEEQEEGRLMLADSEARMERLREKAGVKYDERKVKEDDMAVIATGSSSGMSSAPASSSLSTSKGHINLFEDLEMHAQATMMRASKKTPAQSEAEKGVPLAPSAKDLKPWFLEKSHERSKELEEEKQARDLQSKNRNDPLTSITQQLASRSSSNKHSTRPRPAQPPSLPNDVSARISRESSERQRALELIRRKKRELGGSETPSTVHGGYNERGSGYRDVFNKREVEEAHRGRERRWDEEDRRRGRW